MKRLINFLVLFIVSLIVVKITTYGFRPSKDYPLDLSSAQKQTAKNLEKTVAYLSLEIGNRNYSSYKNLSKTADFLIEQFNQLGYAVEVMPYTIDGKVFNNIIAEEKPKTPKGQTIIIGAHYDSCFNPGADDNASGVAGLIELARLLKGKPKSTRIKFIAFVNEEPPFFMTEDMGSRRYAKAAREQGEKIKGVVILEMIGYFDNKRGSQQYLPLMGFFYPNRGNFMANVSNFPSQGFASKIHKAFNQNSVLPMETLVSPSFIPGIYFSDHWSFWKEGFPAVMITDTAFLRNPNYHKPSDLPNTLDYDRMTLVVHGLSDTILKLAGERF